MYIGYSDIYNTRALIEVTGKEMGLAPEPSLGTHFFQDLVEANIFPLAINLEDEDVIFNQKFFYNTPNNLVDFIPIDDQLTNCLRLIRVSSFRRGHNLSLVMDEERGRATAFLVPNVEAK